MYRSTTLICPTTLDLGCKVSICSNQGEGVIRSERAVLGAAMSGRSRYGYPCKLSLQPMRHSAGMRDVLTRSVYEPHLVKVRSLQVQLSLSQDN